MIDKERKVLKILGKSPEEIKSIIETKESFKQIEAKHRKRDFPEFAVLIPKKDVKFL